MDISNIQSLISSWGVFLIPAVTGIIHFSKDLLPDDYKKYAPLISILTGMILSTLVLGASRTGILVGIIIGLSASGLWSTIKSPFK